MMIAISLGTEAIRSIPAAPFVKAAKKNAAGSIAQGIKFTKSAATIREIENTQKEQVWRQSFEMAVKMLAKFDLAIPMELFDEHHEPLQHH